MSRRGAWTFLSQIKPGLYLLLAASVLLFAGAIIVDINSDDFHTLNFMLLFEWLALYRDRPILYVWIFVLFAVLLVLGINTCLCTWAYIKNTKQSGMTIKKVGIILFHLSFLLFLSGHLVYECTGSSETLILEKGAVGQLTGTQLSLEPVMLQRIQLDIAGKKIRMGTRASITIKDLAGEIATIYPESMKPDFSMGYSFHVGMNEKELSDEQILVIINKSPAIYIFIVGAAGIVVAFLLFMLGSRPSSLELSKRLS
ncbi:MAG: hypothetical protein JRD69_01505 [Deltaproteobacteria bacterium]|nr:hypothetical protein [Deltaproteobacteria bacterium]